LRQPSEPAQTLIFHDWKTYGDIPIQFENIKSFEPKGSLKKGRWTRLYSVWGPPKYWDVQETVDTVTATLYLLDPEHAMHIFRDCVKPLPADPALLI